MKITEVIESFEDAANTISGMTFKCGYEYEITGNETYPLLLLIPPDSEAPDWKNHTEIYSIQFYVMDLLPQSSSDTYKEKFEALKDYAEIIIDYVDGYIPSGATLREEFIKSPKRVKYELFPFNANDRAPAVKVTFELHVTECR